MILYIAKRLVMSVFVLLGVTLVTFILMNVVPGDPVLIMLGQDADPVIAAQLRAELGMDRSLVVQYLSFVGNALQGDLGRSYFTGELVTEVVARRFASTAQLALIAYAISVVVGVSIGVVSAINRGKWPDKTLMSLVVLFMAAPAFWVAMILQIIFGLTLEVLPISGLYNPLIPTRFAPWQFYILPCVALGLRFAASCARFTRTAMLDVIGQDYVRTARAKGLNEGVVIGSHAIKNALIPIITLSGAQLGTLMTGAMLTETVFSIPGIGLLTVRSMLDRDLPMLQGCVIYIASVFVITYLFVDILYTVIDPRMRVRSRKAVG